MNLSLFLFLIGILGFILNRKNIILMIIAIEIMLLSVTLLVLISSFSFDDGIGQTFSIFIISIAGAESVIGLSILVAFYRSSLIYSTMVLGFVLLSCCVLLSAGRLPRLTAARLLNLITPLGPCRLLLFLLPPGSKNKILDKGRGKGRNLCKN